MVTVAVAAVTIVTGGAGAVAAGGAAAGSAAGGAAGGSGAAAGAAGKGAAAGAKAGAAAGKGGAEAAARKGTEKVVESRGKELDMKGIDDKIKKKVQKKQTAAGGGKPGDEDKGKQKRLSQKSVDNLYENASIPNNIRERYSADYLDTPSDKISLRNKFREEHIANTRTKLMQETKEVIEKKEGLQKAEEYQKTPTAYSYELPSQRKWNNFASVERVDSDAVGLTFPGGHIRINPSIVDNYIADQSVLVQKGNLPLDAGHGTAEQIMTNRHEAVHTVATKIGYENRPICDGFAEVESYRQLQLSNIQEAVKNQAALTPDYRQYCTSSYLTETIVGRDDFLFSNNYKGEEHLRDVFDLKAGKGEYEKIYGGIGNPTIKDPITGDEVRLGAMSDGAKIEALQDIYEKKVAKSVEDVNFVKSNVDSMETYGTFKLRRDAK